MDAFTRVTDLETDAARADDTCMLPISMHRGDADVRLEPRITKDLRARPGQASTQRCKYRKNDMEE